MLCDNWLIFAIAVINMLFSPSGLLVVIGAVGAILILRSKKEHWGSKIYLILALLLFLPLMVALILWNSIGPKDMWAVLAVLGLISFMVEAASLTTPVALALLYRWWRAKQVRQREQNSFASKGTK